MQEKIDQIAQWMGWQKDWKRSLTYGQYVWIDSQGQFAGTHEYNPFTNPSDCARVMDEMVKRGYNYGLNYYAETSRADKYEGWLEKDGQDYSAHATTESEAKMNALLKMIEE